MTARRRTADPPKKTGWQVRASVVQAVKDAVEAGAADSQNEFVERAIVNELRERRRELIYNSYAEASADPLFLKDMGEVGRAFDALADEGLPDDES